MKKIAVTVAVALTCLTILLPVIGSCNHSSSKLTSEPAVYRADGWPMPPPIGPPHAVVSDATAAESSLIADGWPMPPPIGPHSLDAVVVV